MNRVIIFMVSLVLGATSWMVCPLVSESFEPFDTSLGLLVGQSAMAVFTIYVGWKTNTINVILSVVGLYIGQNIYSYIFGSSEAKTWAALLLITSTVPCVLPLAGGLFARRISGILQH